MTSRPVEFFPNWLAADLEALIEAHPPRQQAAGAEPWRLLYSGTIGRKQNLAALARTLAGWKIPFRFRICGEDGEQSALDAEVGRLSDGRLERRGFQPLAGFVEELFHADFLLLPEAPGAGAAFFPSKLIPALATGAPILAICDPEGPLGAEIREHDLGIALPWDELAASELLLSDAAALRTRHAIWASNARARARAYRRAAAFDRWERLVANQK